MKNIPTLPNNPRTTTLSACKRSDSSDSLPVATIWPTVTVRPATLEEIPTITALLREQADYFEQNYDLRRCIVFVAEYGGDIVGFTAARLQWQVEPLLLTKQFTRNGPHFARQKAAYLLIRELDCWLRDPKKNTTGIHYYFCHIRDKTMQKLAVSFGMTRVYFGKFFGKDL